MKPTIKTVLAAIFLLAISCKKESNTFQSSLITDKSSTSELVTEINEPVKYDSIKIGTQIWMQKNLTVSHYKNGDKIPQVKDSAAWQALTTGAWCWYNNDSATGAVYGKLYNWYAVNDPRGLAPAGWHVPSNDEWDTLSTYLGNNAGGKMKETGTTHWFYPNKGATNSSGFTALPGGDRYIGFVLIGGYGYWWSSIEEGTDGAYAALLNYTKGQMYLGTYFFKRAGFSVRCIKD